jgi:methionyl aminopeptidase
MSIILKNNHQINQIRKSCRLAAEALRYAEQFAVSGNSTELINSEVENFLYKNKAIPAPLNYNGFPKSTCISINETICHGIPKESDILKEGDIVKIDIAVILDNYFGDICGTFKIGEVSEECRNLVEVTKNCLDIGISQVKPNNEFGMIGKEISKYAKNLGYGVVYQFVGHGVGLKFHEEPMVCHDDQKYDPTKMKPGMIFTIEPMICLGDPRAIISEDDKWTAKTIDGKLSAQFEHTVLVVEGGVEVLTSLE